MKIAYVYDGIYPYTIGGVEKRVWELSTRLVGNGHEVHIFGPKFWKGGSTINKQGVYLNGVCPPPKKRFVEGRRSIGWPIYFSVMLLPALLREKFDVIDCQNFPYFPCFSSKIASKLTNTPLVITWHEVWGDYWIEYLGNKGKFGEILERLSAKLGDRIVAVSSMTKKELERLGVSREIIVIPNGIDVNGIQMVHPDPDRGWDILFTGRLIKEKNVAVLIDVIQRVKKNIPDITCAIIGDGPEREYLTQLILDLQLQDNIEILGSVEEDRQVYSIMKSSKVFVSPSTREGFGMVALEANACGLPVITVQHPRNAMRDLVTEGENGFISEFAEQALAQKIIQALETDGSLGALCLDYARNYDWDGISGNVERVYNGIAKKRIPSRF